MFKVPPHETSPIYTIYYHWSKTSEGQRNIFQWSLSSFDMLFVWNLLISARLCRLEMMVEPVNSFYSLRGVSVFISSLWCSQRLNSCPKQSCSIATLLLYKWMGGKSPFSFNIFYGDRIADALLLTLCPPTSCLRMETKKHNNRTKNSRKNQKPCAKTSPSFLYLIRSTSEWICSDLLNYSLNKTELICL